MNHTENEKSVVDLHLDGLVDYDRKKSELTQPNSQFDEELFDGRGQLSSVNFIRSSLLRGILSSDISSLSAQHHIWSIQLSSVGNWLD